MDLVVWSVFTVLDLGPTLARPVSVTWASGATLLASDSAALAVGYGLRDLTLPFGVLGLGRKLFTVNCS